MAGLLHTPYKQSPAAFPFFNRNITIINIDFFIRRKNLTGLFTGS